MHPCGTAALPDMHKCLNLCLFNVLQFIMLAGVFFPEVFNVPLIYGELAIT
jgi:hypothetical protein